MTYVYYLTSRINSWPQKTKQKSKPILGCLTEDHFTVCQQWGYTVSGKSFLCHPLILFTVPLPSFFDHLAPYCIWPVYWVGRWKLRREVPKSPFHISTVYFPSFLLVTVSSYFAFIKSMNDSLCQAYWNALWEGCYAKKIIVLHNCPVLRDARSPLAPEQTLLSGRSCESRAQCIWEVALSSTLVPRGWPLPQLW